MANSSVAQVLCVVLALCCLQTSLTDSSWDYRGAKNKAAAVTQATGSVSPSAPSSKSVNAAALSTAASSRPGSLNNVTRGQGACGDAMFNDWAGTFNYSFSGQARQAAQKRFCNNMEQVKKINTNMSIPYWASGNAYSHLTFEEFAQQYLTNLTVKRRTPQPVTTPTSRKMLRASAADVPTKTYVNWVEDGKVTPIRNQAGCSSCWAFTAISVIESMYLIANGGNASDPALHLSEQQLVSCVGKVNGYQSHGCSSGLADEAIDYAADHNLVFNSLYPYNASTGTCNFDITNNAAPGQAVRLSAYHQEFPINGQTQMIDEAALIKGVEAAPAVVYFTVDSNFVRYAGGIYTPDPASSNQVNHALVLVGFNTTASSARHWVIRNSWGARWGEKGYARVRMTADASGGAGPNGMYQYAYQAPAGFSSPALQLSAKATLQSTKSPKQASA